MSLKDISLVPQEQLLAGDPGWEEVRVDTSQKFSEWLKEFKTNRSKYNEDERRVVSFYAENVHDFAWVTTPDFVYESGQWNGIAVHALFNQKNGHKVDKKSSSKNGKSNRVVKYKVWYVSLSTGHKYGSASWWWDGISHVGDEWE